MLFLDYLLLFMIGICITYCFILNRRIQDLQNSRIEFARMIKELNASIVKAEHNVNEMSQLSKVTSKEIKSAVDEAREISNELIKVSEVASDISEKLDKQSEEVKVGLHVEDEEYLSRISANSGEKFTDDDLPEMEPEPKATQYTSHLKSFINKVVTRKEPEPANMTQSGYYNTLRKISVKR